MVPDKIEATVVLISRVRRGEIRVICWGESDERQTYRHTDRQRQTRHQRPRQRASYRALQNPDLRCLGCTRLNHCRGSIQPPRLRCRCRCCLWVSCHCHGDLPAQPPDDLTRTHEGRARQFVSTNQDSQAPSAAVSSAQLSSAQPKRNTLSPDPGPACSCCSCACSLSIGPRPP